MSHAEDYILLGLRLGRHVDGLVDAYYGPPELKEQADAEQPADPAELVAERGPAARRARGRLAARPGDRAAHLRRRARRRGALLLRRGRALLRRPPPARRHRDLRGRPRASSRSSCRATGRSASATRTGEPSRFVADEQIVPAIRDVVGAAARRHREARRPPGGRGARPRGGQRRAVVGVQLLPGRSPQPGRRQPRRADDLRRPRRARRPRGLPRPSHGARGQGAAASSASAASWRSRSSWCRRRPRCSRRASPRPART